MEVDPAYTNLEYIDDFFKGKLPSEEVAGFEKRITDDAAFAEEVAFYVASMQLLKKEALQEKKKEFSKWLPESKPAGTGILKKIWPYAAAAVLAAVIAGTILFTRNPSPVKLADQYIEQNWKSLPVKMGATEDSLQTAINLYNEGRWKEASGKVEQLLIADHSNATAKKFAGIVSLRLEDYDKALIYFQDLENDTLLHVNAAVFYHAITLMKRNQSGDKTAARQLLERVDREDLDGKQQAKKWLKQF